MHSDVYMVFVQFCSVFEKEAKLPEYQALKPFGPACVTSRHLVSSSIPIISSMQGKKQEMIRSGFTHLVRELGA